MAIEKRWMLILILITVWEDCKMELVIIDKIKSKHDSFEMRLFSVLESKVIKFIKFCNFDDFKKLDFWKMNLSRYNYHNYSLLFGYLPNERIILDTQITDTNFLYFKDQSKGISFYFVKGFDVEKFSLYFYLNYFRDTIVMFKVSNFYLYKNKKLLDETDCTNSSVLPKQYYLLYIEELSFQYGMKYSTKTCKLIFNYAIIRNIYFMSLTDSFIRRNMLGFIPHEPIILNAKIFYGYFEMYQLKVDRFLLDKSVFKWVRIIVLRGIINTIQNDFFTGFKKLAALKLYALNIRKLFSQGIEWMNSAESAQISNMSNISQIMGKDDYFKFIFTFETQALLETEIRFHISVNVYLYPDEDFCWFKDFPFDRLIYLDPQMYCEKTCSCTQYWLLQYVHYLNVSKQVLSNAFTYSDGQINPKFRDYKKEIHKCNFPKRIVNCNKNIYARQITVDSSFKSALIDSQMADFVIVILIPIISSIGILINIINIVTISRIDLTKTTEEQQQMTLIKFMLAYSIINLIYCVIQSLSLMSKCVEINSIFCSELYFTQFSQWFKIIFVEFIGSSLRTISNVVYFGISVNRYILLEKESKLAKLIEKTISTWSRKKKTTWTIIVLIFLIGLNSHKVVIYRVMNYSLTNFFYNSYPQYSFSIPFFLSNSQVYGGIMHYLSDKQIHERSIVYEVFTYINFVITDIVFYLVFTVVDILLIIAFKKATDKKKNVYKDNLNDAKIQKLLTDMEQNGKKIMRVIIVNTCILLVIKVFDLFMSVSKFKIWNDNLYTIDQKQKLNNFCHTINICSVYDQLVQILYMIHNTFSLVCFYFLNKNFKLNFKKIFSKRTRK